MLFRRALRVRRNGFSVVGKNHCSLLAGWCFDISKMEWVAVVICIGCVFAMELVNTAIERLVDLVSPKFNAKAGLVKDIAAAAVLIASMMSLAVGLIIFVPKIFC